MEENTTDMTKQSKIERNYDEEPIVVENDYLLKSELTSRVALLIFFGWLISINLTLELDSLNELYRRLALGTAVIGIVWTITSNFKMLLNLIKNTFYISIYKNKITYEYINIKGGSELLIINKDDYKNISWSILPIFGEVNRIVDENKTINEKLEYAIGFFPRIIINLFFGLIYYVINLFKIKKYIIISTDNYFISVHQEQNIEKLITNVEGFATITILHSLVIKNSKILKGGNYAK